MRIDDNCQYREGVVLEQPVQVGSKKRDEDRGSLVNCGMRKVRNCKLNELLRTPQSCAHELIPYAMLYVSI